MVYTERAKTAAVSYGTSHVTIKQCFGEYSRMHCKRLQSLIQNHTQQKCSESAAELRIALYKKQRIALYKKQRIALYKKQPSISHSIACANRTLIRCHTLLAAGGEMAWKNTNIVQHTSCH